ncbi:hypothetical protein [Pseudoduganella sp. R-34]|uniref:hypothetical protein n=1 Tax=Pseudoduganella sp. R-34 TaxID=3404062 RepID=UPI003CF5CD24
MILMKTSTGLLLAAIFCLVSGLISYATATGQAVIGPHPVSLEAQRVAIADSTFWWVGSFLVAAIVVRVVARKRKAKAAT